MKCLILLSAVALVACGPVAQDYTVPRSLGHFVDCVNGDMSLCFKEQVLKFTERLRTMRQFKIIEGVTVYNNGPKEAKSLELSSDPVERSHQVTKKLWESTSDLLKNSDVELSWNPTDEDEEESRALDNAVEGRDKKKKEVKKKLKILLPLLIIAKIKAKIIIAISLVIIAAAITKIAVLAKIAFFAKAIALIKYLIQRKHAQEEHGWAPHHEEEHHGHGWDQGFGGGWSRSRNEANNLAYSAYNN